MSEMMNNGTLRRKHETFHAKGNAFIFLFEESKASLENRLRTEGDGETDGFTSFLSRVNA
jgi:hypothetical protein